MSKTTKALTNLLSHTKTLAYDTFSLSQALLPSLLIPSTKQQPKDVLVHHATKLNPPNTMAVQALKIDREYGLVKYYGVSDYTKQKVNGLAIGNYISNHLGIQKLLFGSNATAAPPAATTTTTTTTVTSSQDDNNNGGNDNVPTSTSNNSKETTQKNKKKAKVAFMITSSQRLELMQELNYDPSEIKKLKPLEALVILENQIKPGNELLVQKYVAENEELQRLEALEMQQQQQRRRRRREEEERRRTVEMKKKVEEIMVMQQQKQKEEKDGVVTGTNDLTLMEQKQREAIKKSSPSVSASSSATTTTTNVTSITATKMKKNIDHHAKPQDTLAANYSSTNITNNENDDGDDIMGDNEIWDGWYEVVEETLPKDDIKGEKEKVEAVVVALYREKDEALQCMETKQQFMENRVKAQEQSRFKNENEDGAAVVTYSIRQRNEEE